MPWRTVACTASSCFTSYPAILPRSPSLRRTATVVGSAVLLLPHRSRARLPHLGATRLFVRVRSHKRQQTSVFTRQKSVDSGEYKNSAIATKPRGCSLLSTSCSSPPFRPRFSPLSPHQVRPPPINPPCSHPSPFRLFSSLAFSIPFRTSSLLSFSPFILRLYDHHSTLSDDPRQHQVTPPAVPRAAPFDSIYDS